MLVIRKGRKIEVEEVADVEKTIPIAFEITNSKGSVDYINRKYINEYLKNYQKYYGKDSKIVMVKVAKTINIPLSQLDYSKCSFNKEDVSREILQHRRELNELKKLKPILKMFEDDCIFDINKELDEEMRC